MLIQAVALFLLAMMIMGALRSLRGRLRLPGRGKPRTAMDRLRCPACKRIRIADQPGPCGRPDCEYR